MQYEYSVPMLKNHNSIILFSRPLIIGASISAGHGTCDGGPGAVLARMMNPNAKITNFARSGATSLQSTGNIDFSQYSPSIVMGFDLFFWDVVRSELGNRFETNARNLFNTFKEREVPMIVGKIPEVPFPLGPRFEGIQKNGKKVNEFLFELSQGDQNIILLDPLECILSMDSPKYFSDGLHLTEAGNKFCAEFLANSFRIAA